MTEHEKRIREALEAGPTEGVWHWHGDPVKGDPTGRVRFEVVTSGKTITRIYYSSYEGGPTNAGQDAAHIAACNPAAIRALLADLDEARAALTAAKAGGWVAVPVEPTDEMLAAGKKQAHSNNSVGAKCLRIYAAMLAARPLPNPPKEQA